MSWHGNQLHRLVEQETAWFCQVEQQRQLDDPIMGHPFADSTYHVRTSNCGAATALIQYNLQQFHGISTERVITTATQAPRSKYNSRLFRHVMLLCDDLIVDPTYGQFFGWMGFRVSATDSNDSLTEVFPTELAWQTAVSAVDQSTARLADRLLSATNTPPNQPDYQPLRSAGRATVWAILKEIYTTTNHQPFNLGQADSRQYNELFALSDKLRQNQQPPQTKDQITRQTTAAITQPAVRSTHR